MIVVVGGQARKVGKTQAVCDIISATPHAGWVAVKISPHRHGPAGPTPDTERFLRAGAREAHLTDGAIPAGDNVIVESNSVLESLTPDLVVFVVDPANPDWKHSASAAADRADFVVEGRIPPEVLARIRGILS